MKIAGWILLLSLTIALLGWLYLAHRTKQLTPAQVGTEPSGPQLQFLYKGTKGEKR